MKAWCDDDIRVEDISTENSPHIRHLLQHSALCCDGSVVFHDREEHHVGDPTETAIVLAAHRNGMPKEALNNKYPRLAEIPFDSDRKLMTTVNRIDGSNIVIVKGAFDIMSSRCVSGDLKKQLRSMRI